MSDEDKQLLREIKTQGLKRLQAALNNPETRIETIAAITEKALDRLYGQPTKIVEAELTEKRPIVVDGAFEDVIESDTEAKATTSDS